MRVVILDLTCPEPYCSDTLAKKAMGGTEATVVRVAEGLGKTHEVHVVQHNRTVFDMGEATYAPLTALPDRADVAICLRKPEGVPFLRQKYPGSKLFLWAHDFNQQDFVRAYPALRDSRIKIIGVSRTHKTAIADALLTQVNNITGILVDHVYNPIADDLAPDATPVDRNKLVFFASPHKGLDHALALFDRLKEVDSGFTLTVANPGYYPDAVPSRTGVTNLGSIPHADVIGHVRSSLAVFHPNPVFPETFGLVHAESLAVGTPVLTGSIGANFEIVREQHMMTDIRSPEAVIKKLLAWKLERPVPLAVSADFRLSNVIKRWERLFE